MSAASRIALAEGLGSLTLRRVATAVHVFPGLINHYFPVVDDLIAVAFGHAAAAELNALFAAAEAHPTPLSRMRSLISLLVSEDRDALSLLWLDAWQGSRHRDVLRTEVILQMRAWQERLARLISDGVERGEFQLRDPREAAVRILAAIDGLSVQAAVRASLDYTGVVCMVINTIEQELGLPAGGLASR